jgi:hypothetical protein
VEPLKCEWLYPALDAGFFISGDLSGLPEAELEGEIAQRGPISPARQVLRRSGRSDGIGTKVL